MFIVLKSNVKEWLESREHNCIKLSSMLREFKLGCSLPKRGIMGDFAGAPSIQMMHLLISFEDIKRLADI